MLRVSQAGAATDPGVVSLGERAYLEIREMIVSLELAPGAVIEERMLLKRLEIGRTPVREALRRLAQEQLVEVYPRRAMFVTGVDVRDLARLSEVRGVLEPYAARLAAQRASDLERDTLEELLSQLDGRERPQRELIGLDEQIHRTVYRYAHNELLEATLEQYYVLALRIWYLVLERAQELEDAVHEHRALLEAIRAGDGERAASTMHAHVQNFEQAMRRVLVTV